MPRTTISYSYPYSYMYCIFSQIMLFYIFSHLLPIFFNDIIIISCFTDIYMHSQTWSLQNTSGRDIGANLPSLLNAITAELPSDRSTMLRIGMTNPPFILEHLKEIANVLRHPCVYSFLHVPVQSGSNAVLTVSRSKFSFPFFLS